MQQFDPDIDYYEILQVHPTAHLEIIKRAYRTIVGLLQSHPDLGGSHEEAVRVNQAYQVLSNPQLRQAYDEVRRQQRPHDPPPTPPPARHDPAPASVEGGVLFVACPRCGMRNRLPQARTSGRFQAVCGKCHAPIGMVRPVKSGVHPPRVPINLPSALVQQLALEGELYLQRTHLPSNRQLRCLRCGHEWTSTATGTVPPAACPRCHSAHWSDFRLFQCRHCGHQFTTSSLHSKPYHLFPHCPACQHNQWHPGYEKHPLRWLLNKL